MSEDQDRDSWGPLDTASSEAGLPTVPDDLIAMLDLLAQTIVQALGFGVAVVNIARPDGSLEVVSVAGDEQAREMLLGNIQSAEVWDQFLAMSEPWGRLRFAEHCNEEANPDLLVWIPDLVPIDAPDVVRAASAPWHHSPKAPVAAGAGVH